MSKLARVLTVAGKEIIDTARDRRTILVTLLTAIAAGPVFLVIIFNMTANQADTARELKLPVAGREYAPALMAFLEREQVVIQTAPVDYEAKIRAGDLDVALWVDPAFETDVAAGKPGTVRLIYDRSRDRARAAINSAESLLGSYSRLWGTQRLLLRGIAPEVARPLKIEDIDLATPQQSGSLILFLVAFYGLFAIDDGRHGAGARRDRRRARAGLARASPGYAADADAARAGQVGGDRGVRCCGRAY